MEIILFCVFHSVVFIRLNYVVIYSRSVFKFYATNTLKNIRNFFFSVQEPMILKKKCQLNILHTSYLLSQNAGVRSFRVPGWPTLHTTQPLLLKMGEWNPVWEGSHSSVSMQQCDCWVAEFPKVVVTISTPTSRFAVSPCSSPLSAGGIFSCGFSSSQYFWIWWS